ncbi:hypothetical protein H0N95_02315, partial [Candidatus Micrarchaeota archaeon]|nr:hypothetical protein [Candidatus Micrarchaeota archaeon]
MNIYESKHYKLLLIAPIILLLFSVYFATQVEYGIDLKGGVLITAPLGTKELTSAQLEEKLSAKFEFEDLKVRKISGGTSGYYIETTGEKSILGASKALDSKDYASVISLSKKFTGDLNLGSMSASDQADAYFTKARESFKNELSSFLSLELGVAPNSLSIQDIGPSLGAFFIGQATTAIIIAFVLITLLVFYYFRNLVVSFATVQSAFVDALLGYAVLGMFGIPLSLVTVAPLLMLIGYSVDTDVMLSDRMIKRKSGTPQERAAGALKTGLTMS